MGWREAGGIGDQGVGIRNQWRGSAGAASGSGEEWEEAVRVLLRLTHAPESLRARIHAMLAVELRFGA